MTSPASHATVTFHAISSGIMTKVTIRSAAERWRINLLTRDLLCLFRKSVINTVRLLPAATTNSTEYTITDSMAPSLNVISGGKSFCACSLRFSKLIVDALMSAFVIALYPIA